MKVLTQNSAIALAVAAVLIGCSTTPKTFPELDNARAAVNQVETNPLAGRAAADEVEQAHNALRDAETGATRDDLEAVKQNSYLAKRHADIAREQIAAEESRQAVARGQEERQKALLQAKTQDAEEAQRKLQEQLKDLQAKQTDHGIVLTLGDVLFDTGKATLKPGAAQNIDRLARFLKESPDRTVNIEGHTDSTGSQELNMVLSQRRAEAVKAALMERGVQGDRVAAVGKGPDLPVATNETPAGRQQNRRVVVVIQDQANRG
jgi:outer membrane protein OmpA-like peptidoglycan-associated protein